MKILMHICCSNCSIYPLQQLHLQGMTIKGLWFNPNIHPFTEYSLRRESLMRLQRLWGLDVDYDNDYNLDDFLGSVVGKGPGRCESCYRIRLERTAQTARTLGMDCFTTSLLASPYQKFDMIRAIGSELAGKYGIAFLADDVRQGWHLSRKLTAELGLYRQKYCGCIYSEMERFRK
ncbi:MAG: epoxyqueuosine reductase QueH [Thermodesulfovibrionales bacterium]